MASHIDRVLFTRGRKRATTWLLRLPARPLARAARDQVQIAAARWLAACDVRERLAAADSDVRAGWPRLVSAAGPALGHLAQPTTRCWPPWSACTTNDDFAVDIEPSPPSSFTMRTEDALSPMSIPSPGACRQAGPKAVILWRAFA